MQLHWGLLTLVLLFALPAQVQAQTPATESSKAGDQAPAPEAADENDALAPLPPEALALLATMHEAYSAAPALQDSIHAVFESGMGRQEGDMVIGFQGDDLAIFGGPSNTFLARDGHVIIWYQLVNNKYLEVPLVDDIMTTLVAHMPDSSTLPFQMVLRFSDDPRRQLSSLGMGMIRELAFDRIEPITEGDDAGRVRLHLGGVKGSSQITVDPESGLVHRLELATELNAQPVSVTMELKPRVLPALTIPATFTTAGRKRVTKWSDLHTDVAQPPDVGEQMPDFDLANVDGSGRVQLASLHGSVVVLQFFTSWSKNCPPALDIAEKVHLWVSEENLNTLVFAVDLWEKAADAAGVQAALQPFWKAGGWSMHLLQASGTGYRERTGITGVPLTLVLDKTGKIVFRQIGYGATLEENVKNAIDAALSEATAG